MLDTIIDPFFIFSWLGFPVMGAAGAALTTSITRGISGIIGIYLLFSGKVGIKLKLDALKHDIYWMKRIVSVGVPSSVKQSGNSIASLVLTSLVSIGDRSLGGTGLLLSAYGIGNRISSLIQIVIIGGVGALSTMVGLNLGADQVDRAKEIVKKLSLTFIGITIVESVVFYFLRAPLFRFFINNQAVIDLGSTYITFMVPFIPLFTLYRICIGVFEASGNTKVSMALSLIRLWGLRILLSHVFYFVFGIGVIGI